MGIYVSFFRAINVGGNNKVGMDALKDLHRELGFEKVTSLLQTGNVMFESRQATPPDQLAALIEATFARKFGFNSRVMVRSAVEIQEIFARSPFANQPEKETKWQMVMLLSDKPAEEARQALLSAYKGPEEIHLSGQEIYIYYTNGVGNSKLTTDFMERKLKVSGTGRNWNTLTKLLELTRA